MVIYPFARLFFVDKDNNELFNAVSKGLEIAFEDGSFIELFKSHPSNKGLIELAELDQRTRLYIENPIQGNVLDDIPDKYFYENLEDGLQ